MFSAAFSYACHSSILLSPTVKTHGHDFLIQSLVVHLRSCIEWHIMKQDSLVYQNFIKQTTGGNYEKSEGHKN
jgi:hypothetical protein